MKRRLRRFAAFAPGFGMPCGWGPIYAWSMREARARFRAMLGVRRLPKGAEVWEY